MPPVPQLFRDQALRAATNPPPRGQIHTLRDPHCQSGVLSV